MTSPIPYITPLTAVPGELIQAIGTSASYRLTAQTLLAQAVQLDAHLSRAVELGATETGMDFWLDLGRLSHQESRDIFVSIREHREATEQEHPLLDHAANLLDYVSHITTNLLPMTKREPMRLGWTAEGAVGYHNIEARNSFEWSIAIYLGLSPFPIFGTGLDYGHGGIAGCLEPFGWGVVTYLSLALRPELAADGILPAELPVGDTMRPLARPSMTLYSDRSIISG